MVMLMIDIFLHFQLVQTSRLITTELLGTKLCNRQNRLRRCLFIR